jgi:hypothetical protein
MSKARVLIVGQDPDTVDFSDPALIPGMTADKVRAGVTASVNMLTAAGFEAEQCSTDHGETAEAVVTARIQATRFDCVMVGAGIRLPPSKLVLFEKLVNAIHRNAPDAAICFNTRPDDCVEAVRRWLPQA